jgi:hypothetical protein
MDLQVAMPTKAAQKSTKFMGSWRLLGWKKKMRRRIL